MRIILFTGKGGVGKTTTAAATALACANAGKKTLVVSTDPAHSLSDALNVELAPEPTQINDLLWGQEFDVYYSMKKHWDSMRQLMSSIFKWKGVDEVVADELSVLPGMEEAAAFLWIEQFYREKQYDVLIIDSAPTGETLTLLTLPQVVQSWLFKAFPGQKLMIKALGKVLKKTKGIPLDEGYDELIRLFEKLEDVRKIMLDDTICSIRIVVNPERMVIQEAKRAFTYLNLYGYNVDAVVINRIFPTRSVDESSFFYPYIAAQEKYLAEIEESFQPLPIFKMHHQGKEVFGLHILDHMSQHLYGDTDPAQILNEFSPFKVENEGGQQKISLYLPFISSSDYQVEKYGDELMVTLQGRKKSILLPRFTNFLQLSRHEYHDSWLSIYLQK